MGYRKCPNCHGSGKDFYNHVCHICKGKKKVWWNDKKKVRRKK